MLRVVEQKSSSGVKSYYDRSDYYESGPDALKGHWFGKAAQRLGLTGEVDKKDFDRIVDNLHPNEDESLTPRTRENRRIGWDVTFSVSKSVSLLWALTEDHRILDAVKESVNETLKEIEQNVLTRVHRGKSMHTEKPGNMTAATWLHTTSRPVGGVPMPQLHVHAWIANHCFFGDGMRAIDMSGVKKDAPYFEARFHSRLAAKLQERFELGIERQGRKWFEIKGIPREVVERYSERMKQIEDIAKAKGIESVAEKASLGARTREAKVKAVAPEQLHQLWREKLEPGEAGSLARAVSDAGQVCPTFENAEQSVAWASKHLFERESGVRERHLATEALWHGIGKSVPKQIDRAIEEARFIRKGKDEHAWVTTKEVLKEEQQMLSVVREDKGILAAISPEHQISRSWLSDEQQRAVKDLLRSQDRVVLLEGKAGVGKTTVAAEFEEGARESGVGMQTVAPTTKAVSVLKKDGFAAITLAKFLKDKEVAEEARGKIVFLDEAGMAATPDLAKLVGLARKHDFRVVLSGDSMQHRSIARGKGLNLLKKEAGIQVIGISTIRRQVDQAYRRVVETLSRGRSSSGLTGLEKMGALKEITDTDKRLSAIASRYTQAIDEGDSVLVVAPSIAEKEDVTRAIRGRLKDEGRLGKEELAVDTLKSRGLTQAEKEDARRYKLGDVVEFHARGKGGFKPGDRAVVTHAGENAVRVDSEGVETPLPLSSSNSFDVFESKQDSFSTGDVIKITRNRRAKTGQKRLNNGQKFTVQGFTKDGQMRLGGGLNLDPNWGFFEHGIVTTSYSSQGDTSDRVLVAQSSKSFNASSPEQLYVSISRGRKQAGLEVFTDDAHGLKQAVSRERESKTATELARSQRRGGMKGRIDQLRHTMTRTRKMMRESVRQVAQLLRQSNMQPRQER
ncbi:MAG: hypothetical protein Aurels2KO_39320 [Aureliella sp.]